MYWRPLALAFLCAAVPADAFDFSYGAAFGVAGAAREKEVLRMPLTRGKYANVRVLTRPVYEFLLSCKEPCRMERRETDFKVAEIRAAKTRPGMWIADVDFNAELEITFLVFKNKNGYSVKPPEAVTFTDQKLLARVRAELETLAEKTQ